VVVHKKVRTFELAKKFPQLKLATSKCLDHLKEGFKDFLQKFSPSLLLPVLGIQVSSHIEQQRK